jgi:hypothetical protein
MVSKKKRKEKIQHLAYLLIALHNRGSLPGLVQDWH